MDNGIFIETIVKDSELISLPFNADIINKTWNIYADYDIICMLLFELIWNYFRDINSILNIYAKKNR